MSLHAILQSAAKNARITVYLVNFQLSNSNVTFLEKWRVSNINYTWMTRGVILGSRPALGVMHYSWFMHGQHYTSRHSRVIYVTHLPFFKEWHYCLFEEWTKHFLESYPLFLSHFLLPFNRFCSPANFTEKIVKWFWETCNDIT